MSKPCFLRKRARRERRVLVEDRQAATSQGPAPNGLGPEIDTLDLSLTDGIPTVLNLLRAIDLV